MRGRDGRHLADPRPELHGQRASLDRESIPGVTDQIRPAGDTRRNSARRDRHFTSRRGASGPLRWSVTGPRVGLLTCSESEPLSDQHKTPGRRMERMPEILCAVRRCSCIASNAWSRTTSSNPTRAMRAPTRRSRFGRSPTASRPSGSRPDHHGETGLILAGHGRFAAAELLASARSRSSSCMACPRPKSAP